MSREIVSAKFTRPADTTAYASGDLVANSTTAGSVVAMNFGVTPGPLQIRRVRVSKTGTSVTNTSFRLHLYAGLPTVANGDNGAISSTQAANYLGQVDVSVAQAFSDGAAGMAATEINCFPAGVAIYGLLEARAAYTPASAEVFTVALEIV